jgi:hypothetical protein
LAGKAILVAILASIFYLAAKGRLDAVVHAIATGHARTIGAAAKGS